MTKTPISAVKDALWAHGIYNATVSTLKSGALRVRRSYYYRPAEGLDRYAARVALAPLGYTTARVADEWAAWPKSSYFTVELRREEEPAIDPYDPSRADKWGYSDAAIRRVIPGLDTPTPEEEDSDA